MVKALVKHKLLLGPSKHVEKYSFFLQVFKAFSQAQIVIRVSFKHVVNYFLFYFFKFFLQLFKAFSQAQICF